MAVDAMDIDTPPVAGAEVERKRKHKHKNKDSSPSKKRKQTDDGQRTLKSKKDKAGLNAASTSTTTEGTTDSPFALTTATLYLPLSPISISPTHALASLLAEHLSPLLLTYYPPLKGVVLAYSNASISNRPPSSAPRHSYDSNPDPNPNPQPLTLATPANEYGVLYVYLTATFLVFRPKRGQTLEGWVNVQSEGFLGAVIFNLFSAGIERKRLPTDWTWVPPGGDDSSSSNNNKTTASQKTTLTDDESADNSETAGFDAAKEHFQPATLSAEEIQLDVEDEEDESAPGYFQSVSGHRVRGTVRFRVVDVDVIPGSERDRGFLCIEGTMLSPAEEEALLEAERQGHTLPLPFVSTTPKKVSGSIPVSDVPPPSAVQDVSVVDVEAQPEPSKEKDKKGKKSKKSKSKSKSSKEE